MSDSDSETVALLTLPLDAWHRARGGRMVPFAGYAMPVQYEGVVAEHVWTRSSASLFDVSHMGQIELRGEGADVALEALVPGDIRGLGKGRLRYTLLLNGNGGIIDDLMVTRRADQLYLVVDGATKQGDIAHLRWRLPDDVALVHLEDQALLALQGPKAVDALERLVPGIGALRFMQAGAFSMGTIPLWISRSGYTGEDGFEISVAASAAEELANRLLEQGEVKPAGLGGRDTLRLEAGLPLYGHDLDASTSPVEAGLTFALSKRRREMGDFQGGDRVVEELSKGAPRRRVGLLVDGRQPVREGALIRDEQGHEVGRVTSGTFSPTLQRPIAMGYVHAEQSTIGTRLILEARAKQHPAEVAPLPFVAHRYVR